MHELTKFQEPFMQTEENKIDILYLPKAGMNQLQYTLLIPKGSSLNPNVVMLKPQKEGKN